MVRLFYALGAIAPWLLLAYLMALALRVLAAIFGGW